MSQKRGAARTRVLFSNGNHLAFDNSNLIENIPPRQNSRKAPKELFDDVSFSDMFQKKWNARCQQFDICGPEPVEFNYSDDDIDKIVIAKPKNMEQNAPKAQTPESVLRDIDLLVDKVHEICSRRSQPQ